MPVKTKRAAGERSPLLREGWATLEEKIESERQRAEAAAGEAGRAGDRDGAAEILGEFMTQTVEQALDCAERLRSRIA